MSDTGGLRITETTVKLPKWLAVLIAVGAFSLGGVTVEARLQLSNVKDQLIEVKAKQESHAEQPAHPIAQEKITRLEEKAEEAKRDDAVIRQILGKIQLNQAAICQATKAECKYQ